jgi:hypothetical protein
VANEGTFGRKTFGEAAAQFGGPTVTGGTQIGVEDSAVGSESTTLTTAFSGAFAVEDSAVGSESYVLVQPTPSIGVAVRVEIHDPSTHALIEILENAYNVGYEVAANQASIAHFSLPRDDAKWSAIQAFREVWLYDAYGDIVDVFRVMPFQELHNDSGTTAVVNCEGYASVLQDDLVSDELIWTNQTVTTILTDLLAYQATPRVTLGTVDPVLNIVVGGFRVAYDNVMKGCWEVRNLTGGYISVDPVAGNPAQRRLNLRADPGQDIGQRVWTGYNLRAIGKTTDPTQAVTKLFPLGRGEGRNQQRPSTDILLAQTVTFVAGGAGRSTLTIADAYSRYKGWTGAGQPLPTAQTALDTRTRPITVRRNGLNDSANWEQGSSERELRSKTNGYNPGGSWVIDYVHADYLIADDTIGTYGTIAQALPEKRFETSLDLIRASRNVLDAVKQSRVTYTVSVADIARVYPTESFERLHLHDRIQVVDTAIALFTKLRIVRLAYADMWRPDTLTITVGSIEPTVEEIRLRDRQRSYETMGDGATVMWVDSFEDNVDGTHPYTRDIYIPPDAVSVNKIACNVRMKPYRYYVSSTSSGGSVISSSTGGAQSPTSTSNSPGHGHTVTSQPANTGVASPPISDGHWHGYNDASAQLTAGESIFHTHVVTLAAHQHTTDTTHGHSITAGIVETTTPGTLQVDVDGNVAHFGATSVQELDLTPFLSKNTDGTIERGWHTVRFSSGVGRVQGSIVVQVFLMSRGKVSG